MYVGLGQLCTNCTVPKMLCTELKTYTTNTSCNQLSWTISAMYMLIKINLLVQQRSKYVAPLYITSHTCSHTCWQTCWNKSRKRHSVSTRHCDHTGTCHYQCLPGERKRMREEERRWGRREDGGGEKMEEERRRREGAYERL